MQMYPGSWQRRRNRQDAGRGEQQEPGVKTGKSHDDNAEIATGFGCGGELGHLGVFIIILAVFAVLLSLGAVRFSRMYIAMSIMFSFSFSGGLIGIGAISLAPTTQVPGAGAKDDHRKGEERRKQY